MRLALDVREAFMLFDKQPPQDNQRSLCAPASNQARHSMSNVLIFSGDRLIAIYSNEVDLAIGR